MSARIWLPARRRIGEMVARVPALRDTLAQSTRLPDQPEGAGALCAAAFMGFGEALPVAALTRRIDAPGDRDGRWLRVDPCHLRVEISGVRMLACGPGLDLGAEEASALASAVRPLFEQAGWRFDASAVQRWYAQPPSTHQPIGGDAPEAVLGAFIDSALPAGDAGRATRQWLNELQMALHEHPSHRQRRQRGQFEVNSLWLHGDGTLAQRLQTSLTAVCSSDALLLGCADAAGIRVIENLQAPSLDWLLDARSGEPMLAHLQRALGMRVPMLLQLESGERFQWRPWHRLRVWRREPA